MNMNVSNVVQVTNIRQLMTTLCCARHSDIHSHQQQQAGVGHTSQATLAGAAKINCLSGQRDAHYNRHA